MPPDGPQRGSLGHGAPEVLADARPSTTGRDVILEVVRMAVSLLEARDPTTGDHCWRVSGLAVALLREMGYEPDDDIKWGFVLHDIGKVAVPDAILRKPGPLTAREWEVVRRHPQAGASILRSVRSLQRAVPVVLHHHERWDGSGYPAGLAGPRIPLAARAFAVADAFDAITEDRPYRRGRSLEEAVAVLWSERGRQFDPDCVEAFVSLVERVEMRPLRQA